MMTWYACLCIEFHLPLSITMEHHSVRHAFGNVFFVTSSCNFLLRRVPTKSVSTTCATGSVRKRKQGSSIYLLHISARARCIQSQTPSSRVVHNTLTICQLWRTTHPVSPLGNLNCRAPRPPKGHQTGAAPRIWRPRYVPPAVGWRIRRSRACIRRVYQDTHNARPEASCHVVQGLDLCNTVRQDNV